MQAVAIGARRRLRPARAGARRILRRVRPLRPPLEPPDVVRRLSRPPHDDSFLTGNGIAARCRFVLNYDRLTVNRHVENNWWFCKSDFLEYFFRRLAPREPFVLFTHNSDRALDHRCERWLRRDSLIAWFGVNVEYRHPKLFAIPLGIANPRWPHGETDVLLLARREQAERTSLFHASYSLATNPGARLYCAEQTGVSPTALRPFAEYVRDLRRTYFCISPRGNGIDCHRTWEALYLGTVPVVTRSVLTDQHPDLPWIVLEDWSDFRSIDFTPDLYERTWSGWDADELRLDRYLERVRAQLASLR